MRINQYEIINGDVFEELPKLAESERKFGALVADPPYCSGGMTPASTTSSRGLQKYIVRDDLGTFTDSMSQRAYTLYTSEWLRLARGCLKENAYFFIFTDWRQYPTVSDAVMIAGYTWRGAAVWDKMNCRPNKGYISRTAEFIIWGTVGPLTSEKVQSKGVFSFSAPASSVRIHPTEKRWEVFAELLKVLPDDAESLLDPFAGSAPAGVAALRCGLDYVGIEAEERYADVSTERLKKVQTELRNSF